MGVLRHLNGAAASELAINNLEILRVSGAHF
jgi:hypothetical protein